MACCLFLVAMFICVSHLNFDFSSTSEAWKWRSRAGHAAALSLAASEHVEGARNQCHLAWIFTWMRSHKWSFRKRDGKHDCMPSMSRIIADVCRWSLSLPWRFCRPCSANRQNATPEHRGSPCLLAATAVLKRAI